MSIKFYDVEKQLTMEEIFDFQKNFNLVLPDNYKKLILKYNGGIVDGVEYVDSLLSIKYGEVRVEDTIAIHQQIEHNIPTDYFPFADDWSNNPITICLKEGNDYGKIVKFYFDTDDDPEIIAKSLEELFGVTSIDEL